MASDPYARSFVNPLSMWGTRLVLALRVLRLIGVEPMFNFAIVRERYIHDLMRREAASVEQVVILGAGFDTRAYRTPELVGLKLFEIDHPVTQVAKRSALARAAVDVPGNVVFVAVDFDRDDLGERLLAEGYDPKKRTLFVWQGVIMYLTAAGIDRTLGLIARAAQGSMVVFDYIDDGALHASQTATLRFFTRAMGEAMTFGIPDGALRGFLESRGFSDVGSIGGAGLKRTYMTGANAGRPVAADAAIAWARVGG